MEWLQEKYIKAGHPETAEDELRVLAADAIHHVRRRVAENVKTPVELLLLLVDDDHVEVRMAVAENVNVPQNILRKLACDEQPDVRYSLAENPNIPEEILIILAEDENPYVRSRAHKTLRLINPVEPIEFKPRQDVQQNTQRAYRIR